MRANDAIRSSDRVVTLTVCLFMIAATPSPSMAKPAGERKSSPAADPFEDSTITGKPNVPAKTESAQPAGSPAAPKVVAPTASPPASAKATTAGSKESAPPAHVPSKEFGAFMRGFEGSWKCDTHFAAGALWPGSQPVSSKTEVTIRREFDGFMWHGEFRMAKTATSPGTVGVFQIGYATPSRQVTYLSYDSIGSSMMGVGTISGAQVTFMEEGFMKGAKVSVRETLAKQGPRRIAHKVEVDQGNGLQLMAEDICVK